MDIGSVELARFNATQIRPELPRNADEEEQLRAVAVEFEALFAKQMLDAMRQTLRPENDIFNGGMAEEIFQDMLYEEYARQMAGEGSLGIAEILVDQLSSGGVSGSSSAGRAAQMYDSLSANG